MEDTQKDIDSTELMRDVTIDLVISQVGSALADIDASTLDEAQKFALQVDLVSAEYQRIAIQDGVRSPKEQALLDQLHSLAKFNEGEAFRLLGQNADAIIAGTAFSILDVVMTLQSYSEAIDTEKYGDAFAEATGVLAGSLAAKAALSAGYTGPLAAALIFGVGFTFEWGLKESKLGDELVELSSELLNRVAEDFPLQAYDKSIDEFIAELSIVTTALFESGVSGVEEIDAFLSPIMENWTNGSSIVGSWNAWEFAAHDVYDQQPTFSNAQTITSPIIIDLDADGVETTTLGDGVYFDHDGNGLAEKSAWASSDDGLLAMDRDGDGVIDSGAELFGSNTKLADGTLASNGFEALAELDSNADGIIDADDQAYADLRIWRDANLDGVSQADELLTLAEAGVSAIATGYQNTQTTDSSGNRTLQAGSATLVDGTEVAANDVWFQTNRGLTETVEQLELSSEIAALPTAQGFGNLHNLDQAMARDQVLVQLVTQYVETESSSERRALVDSIIYQWAGVSDVDPHSRDASRIYGHVMDARQLETLEELVGQEYLGTWCWGERDPNPHGRAAPVLIAQYQQFAEVVYAQLESQTAYADLFDLIGVKWDSSTLSFVPDMAPLVAALEVLIDEGAEARVIGAFEVLKALGSYSTTYTQAADEVANAPNLALLLASNLIEGTELDDHISGSDSADLIYAKTGDDQMAGGTGDDTYSFQLGDGTDSIYDRAGNDKIRFGEGISQQDLAFSRTATELIITRIDASGAQTGDQIVLQNLFDFDGSIAEGAIETLSFHNSEELSLEQIIDRIDQRVTDGDDHLYGSDTSDEFDAGQGADHLYGGAGNDTYRFERGDGADEIYEHSGVDTLSFGAGIGPESLQLVRTGEQGEDILIEVLNEFGEPTDDSILIRDAYQNLAASDNQIEWLTFDDERPEAEPLPLMALIKAFGISESDDLIYGFESDDQIESGGGSDQVHSAGGSDRLDGGAGDDKLFGEAGDDFLSGGAGNDLLSGGSGDDRYLFTAGMGHDRVRNLDTQGFDSIVFDASINSKRLVVSRVGDDLLLSHNRNAESLLLENYFDGDRVSDSAVDQFLFADGHELGLNEIADLTLQTTQGDDYVQGLNSQDSISAQAGNDLIFGGGGDDTLYGDQGADQLYGDAGNDLLYGGAGQDQLTGGLGQDQLYGGAESDLLKGNAGSDRLFGERGDDQLLGGSQNDLLDGGRGDDRLEGESGDDTLLGARGNDILIGGAGDDQLDGGQGNDTYLYRAGDGDDQILRSGDPEGFDILAIENFDQGDLWLSQRDDDLIVSFKSEAGSVTVNDWFSDNSTIDAIEVGEVQAFAADIERMVESMIAFDAAETEAEVADAQVQLSSVLSESWHLKAS